MKNLTGEPMVIVDRATYKEIAIIPTSDERARVTYKDREVLEEGKAVAGVPLNVTIRAVEIPASVRLPAEPSEPVLVSLYVARAMRDLGMKHPGGVYTGDYLIFARSVPIGYAGLNFWEDLSA